MKSLSLNAKIFMIIGFLIAISVFILVRSLGDLATVNDRLNYVVDNTAEAVKLAGRMNTRLIDIGRTENLMILSNDEAEIRQHYNDIQRLRGEIIQLLENMSLVVGESNRQRITVFRSKFDEYLLELDKIYELALQNSNRRAMLLVRGNGQQVYEALREQVNRLSERASGANQALIQAELANLLYHVNAVRVGERDLILSDSDEVQRNIIGNMDRNKRLVDNDIRRVERLVSSNLASQFERVEQELKSYLRVHEEVVSIARLNSNRHAMEISSTTARQLSDDARGISRQIVDQLDNNLEEEKIASDQLYSTARNSLLITSALGIIIAIAIASFIMLNLSRKISQIISSLRQASSEVANASLQLSSSAQQLSNMSTEQAGSIEETSSSLEEISGMIDNNLINTKETVELMKVVCGTSKEGNQLMQTVEDYMEKIHKSNDQIKDLVKIISNIGEKTQVMDEIVFQTKLLSFNASVEAERAGEHGRGFAVVAQEVGNLAAMSGKAAQEIAQIVKHSIKEAEQITENNKSLVDKGVDYVKETSGKLRDILSSSEDVAGRAQEVLTASQEQSSGVKQINSAISQLDKATQENAASAEEAASTSEELSSQTENLAEIVRDLTLTVRGSSKEIEREYQQQKDTMARHKSAQAHHGSPSKGNVLQMHQFKEKEPAPNHIPGQIAVGAEPLAVNVGKGKDQEDSWDRL